MKRVFQLLFTFGICLFLALPASAALWTVTDLNSSFTIDDCVLGCSQGHGPGMVDWTVDGIQTLYDQWFWFRVGSTGGESALSTLPVTVTSPASDALDMTFTDNINHFTVLVEYDLTGGAIGSRTSDIGEIIKITNTGSSNLNMHFFQYSDFDLNRKTLADYVTIDPTLRFVDQVPAGAGNFLLSESIVTPKPNHAEANYFANTLNKLSDGNPTTLDGTLTAGAGDVTWAFQWDKTIAAGSTFIISKDKNLYGIPEPATVTLLGGILLLVASKLRFRKA